MPKGQQNTLPVIHSFTAFLSTINQGQSSELEWSATGATSFTVTRDIIGGTVYRGIGTRVRVSPTETTTYILTATNNVGSVTSTVTVTVILPLRINSFRLGKSRVIDGERSFLFWSIQGAGSFTVAVDGSSTNLATSGSFLNIFPSVTTTYRLTAYRLANFQGTSVTSTLTITVYIPTTVPTITRITQDRNIFNSDQTIISWQVSGASEENVYLRVSGSNTNLATGSWSSATVSPTVTTTYILTATNIIGTVTSSVTITVINLPLPTISSSSTSINSGESLTLTWSVDSRYYTYTVFRKDQPTVTLASSARSRTSITINPTVTSTGTYTFEISARTRVGTRNFTNTVNVLITVPTPVISSFTATPASITSGQSSTLSWSATRATSFKIRVSGAHSSAPDVYSGTGTSVSVSPTATITYILTATNSGGSVTSTTTVTVTQPLPTRPTISSFIASPASITRGQSSTLSWSISGHTSFLVQVQGAITNLATSGTSLVVSPTTTTIYALAAYNTVGQNTAQRIATTIVTVTEPPVTPVEPETVHRGFRKGTTEFNHILIGTKPFGKIYKGTALIWESATGPTISTFTASPTSFNIGQALPTTLTISFSIASGTTHAQVYLEPQGTKVGISAGYSSNNAINSVTISNVTRPTQTQIYRLLTRDSDGISYRDLTVTVS